MLKPPRGTRLLRKTENAEVVRRRGRWLSVKTLEIYLQEVQVSTYLERVKPDAKVLIELRSSGFAPTLDRCIDFLQCGVPPNTWYYLFREQNFLSRDLEEWGLMENGQHRHPMHGNRRTFRITAAKQEGACPNTYACIRLYTHILVLLKANTR